MTVVIVTLQHVKLGAIMMETVDNETRVFSSREKAEDWLLENGFSIGKRTWFVGEPLSWCREGEKSWDHIDVDLIEIEVDSSERSKYSPIQRSTES